MMTLQDFLMILMHHGYMAVVDFVVEISHEFVTHLVLVFVVKAGVVHVGWKIVKRRRKATKAAPAPWEAE